MWWVERHSLIYDCATSDDYHGADHIDLNRAHDHYGSADVNDDDCDI